MGASPLQLRRHVIFPGARASIFLGLKLGVPEALIGAIVGEFVSSSHGIGYMIQYATAQLDTAGVFAGLLVLTILSLILNALVNKASKKTGASR
jgi:NitT/TauT family transport system permease protein